MNKDLGFGEEQYAVLASFGFTALFTVFSLIAGRAADKLNRAQVVAAGAAAWSVASIAQATATSFDSILDLRALTGVSQAFLNPQVNLSRCFGLAGLPLAMSGGIRGAWGPKASRQPS